jgi:hypothetical protein
MADKKISQLTAASTPLAGTEVLPIVQSGATVKIAVSDVTAGRAVSGTQFTASTGNFILGTAGQGIDFSVNPAAPGMTSELLNDYEEGTWTPRIEGSTTPGTTTYTIQRGSYTKVGRLVTCSFTIQWSATTAAGNLKIFGLPFTNTTPNGDGGFFIANGTATGATGYVGAVQTGGTFIFVYSTVAATDYVFSTIQYFG